MDFSSPRSSSPATDSNPHFALEDSSESPAESSGSQAAHRTPRPIDFFSARARSGSIGSSQPVGFGHGHGRHAQSLATGTNQTPFTTLHSSTSNTGVTSLSHAGGILPPSTFFNPSRPHIAGLMPKPRRSNESEVSGSVGRASTLEDPQWQMGAFTSSRPKQSREPLLPIGGNVGVSRVSTSSTRPKLQTVLSSAASNAGVASPGARVRTSIERAFKRTLSLESNTRPKLPIEIKPVDGQPPPLSAQGGTAYNFINFGPVANGEDGSGHLRNRAAVSSKQTAYPFLPPPASEHLDAVPRKDPQTGHATRKWQLHPSKNTFCFDGRFLTGGDNLTPFIVSLVLVFGITATWLATTSVYWWQNESPAVTIIGIYIALVAISSMFATALQDPGILPRGLDPDPPMPSNLSMAESNPTPLPRDLKVRRGAVRVKYCTTCETYRPPRSSHCRICDNCVDGCDHHCQWVNNCVGRRNYTSFFAFLTAAVLGLCLYIVTAGLHIYFETRRERVDFKGALSGAVGSAVVFSLSIIVFWPVVGLFGYHSHLLLTNMTTVEAIRSNAQRSIDGEVPLNVFRRERWYDNVAELLCRPQGMSWLDAHSIATEDQRRINPGFAGEEQNNDEKTNQGV